ncbi:MAG TPA: glycosyltransferase [Desulfobulbus sp.]|nr:glycosyltransferase [Desulfobulbus sp.]
MPQTAWPPSHPDPVPGFRDRLIVFTRYPRPGRTKTRLIPLLGREGAAEMQRLLTERLLARIIADPLLRDRTTVHFTGGSRQQMRRWLGPQPTLAPQRGADLGRRMLAALVRARTLGNDHIILVGADCPALDAELLRHGFALLAEHDLVIGPSRDGGYYLIGISARTEVTLLSPLFTDMAWSTSRVLAETLARAGRLGLSCGLLTTLVDIDRPEDLAYFHHHPGPR